MAAHQKLVNKQFNSPINLYSAKNVNEILERESRILSNGAIGIDFNNPMVNKPANLQNSAVLRMLEEEENRKRDGQPGSLKRVAWPPPSDSDFVEQAPVESQGGPIYSSKSAPGLQNNHTPTQHPVSPNYQQTPQSPKIQPGPAGQTASPNYQSQSPISTSSYQFTESSQSTHSQSPTVNKSPSSFAPQVQPWGAAQSPSFNQLQFRSVHAPQAVTKQQTIHSSQSSVQEYQISQEYQSQPFSQSAFQVYQVNSPQPRPETQPSYQVTPQSPLPKSTPVQPSSPQIQSASPQQFQSFAQPSQYQPTTTPTQATAQSQFQPAYKPAPAAVAPKSVEPPPSTITLRPQAPVSQAPPPVITSQPATATLRGGKNLRGDLKWPPEEVKEKMEAEKVHLVELQKGPQFRPRKQRKDYSRFFAQHALNSTYPGYKIPPGTQFYDHNPVM